MKNCITITSAKVFKSDYLGHKCQRAHAEVFRLSESINYIVV